MTETLADQPYGTLKSYLESFGWDVVCCDIQWDDTVLTDWLTQARKTIEDHKSVEMFFGFSAGGLMALILSAEYDVDIVVGASPSPYLREELPFIPPMCNSEPGARLVRDLENYSVELLTKSRARRIEVLLGSSEWQSTIDVNHARCAFVGEKLHITTVPEAPHDVRNPLYLETVQDILYDCTCETTLCGFSKRMITAFKQWRLSPIQRTFECDGTPFG